MLRDIIRPGTPLIQNVDGILMFEDSTRNKVLSVTRENLSFGIDHRNISGKRWLKTSGNVVSSLVGYKIPRDATITSITIETQNIVTDARFNIRKNNSISNIHTTNLLLESEIIEDNLNYNINKGDYLQLYLWVVSGNVDYPVVTVELAWR
jgi:hypothetical protein